MKPVPPATRAVALQPTFTQLTTVDGIETMPDLSPDGDFLVYVGGEPDGEDLFLLRVGGRNPINLTESPDSAETSPAFSPDGQSIAYWSVPDMALKRIAIAGGAPVVIASVENNLSGAHWGSDNNILFSQPGEGLYRISASGGTPEQIFDTEGEWDILTPEMLPDGDTVLYTRGPPPGSVAILSLTSGESRCVRS